jgi:sugar transferase (PEP-CTERM/EpsH1 system associated)
MPAPLIAHILHRLDYGGLENGVVNLINGLPPEMARHTVICMTDAADFRQRIRRPDVEVHQLHKRPGKDPAAYWRLWRLLRRLRPAVVHTRNTGVLDCQFIARLAGVGQRIHGYHGWDVGDLHGDNPRQQRLRRLLDPLVSRYVVVSRQIGAWLESSLGVDPDRIEQICNGVDTTRFSPAPDSGSRPREPLVVGTVGRLQAVKNQALLVEAFGRLLARRPELASRLRLVLGGDGPERSRLEAAIAAAGLGSQVVITGWRDDVPALLREFHVFVLPSLNEGISNTILEAMATGLPVVATDVGGNGELVEDGVTGFLVPSGDADALAGRLAAYADDPELLRAHGLAARRRAESEFSIRRMLERYENLYRRRLPPVTA